ncbi:phytanoyl-CoA dioxygenase [Salinisphaera sp. PC39]|uniref:phytanoyl-CoA dioxygenase family protein n=1 Tax=Salinisphaera sp. PC39 TaxID=1304156 RepID=UPI00334026A6
MNVVGEPVLEPRLTPVQREAFARDGYLVMRRIASAERVQNLRRIVADHLARAVAPIEYEADVAYPGAPAGRDAEGGDTPRRLRQAYDRDPAFAEWARDPRVTAIVAQLLDSTDLRLTRCHHNCVMTKHPGYSSATLWHRDVRYWRFSSDNLVNAWLALGDETPDNGCMWLLPGSHRLDVAPERLDEAQFLRDDLPANRELIATARSAPLEPGDVLFFHAAVFHAAGRNATDIPKLSAVFTYHDAGNRPEPGSRSACQPAIDVATGEPA